MSYILSDTLPENPKEAHELHKLLTKKIREYNKQYYENNNSEVSDAEYDQLMALYKNLEHKFPLLKLQDSVADEVGGSAAEGFKKIEHKIPMLSLSNIFEEDEINDFIEKIQRFLKINYIPTIVAELKIDGVSFSATYKNGKLLHAATRGDGYVGEDITENIKTIKGFPQQINLKEEFFEVRGEVYIRKDDFEALNESSLNQNKHVFANPRNAASGSLRQLDSNITKMRPLKYFVYSLGAVSSSFSDTQSNTLMQLGQLGFCVNENFAVCHNIYDIVKFYEKFLAIRDELPYEIDGIVYKVNDLSLWDRLGYVGKTPRFATAHKFPAALGKTKVLDIKIQVGRTGALTPVAILEPVNIGGAEVTRASLHNFDEIFRKDIRIGDIVTLKRAGDVIPQIDSVSKSDRLEFLKAFEMPSICPSCGEKVDKQEDDAVLRCGNSLNCPDQKYRTIVHFISKACFDIAGLAKKNIEFLLSKKYINNAVDIFDIPDSQDILYKLAQEPGWGAVSVQNLVNSIIRAKNISLDRFIFSLGIRHVGALTSKELAKIYTNAHSFLEAMQKLSNGDQYVYESLINIDGLGNSVIESLSLFFSHKINITMVEKLIDQVQIIEQKTIYSHLQNKLIVFTGTLKNSSRQEAKSIAEKLGAKVTSSITSKTDYLVVGDSPGSKLKEAQKQGVKILNEEAWEDLVK
ncbi:MAG: NAD-dependent DNA ligase LigA [Rickettsiaceae bacterium]|nr:NAD-dependent DNA ligase LigA [Rickettsiaceae bacterium]